MNMNLGTKWSAQRLALSLAACAIIAGGLSACSAPQPQAPAAAPPAATNRAQEEQTGSPSPVAEFPLPSCDEYRAWLNDPDVHAALEKSALWPEVVADAEKAANGEQYDKSHARQLFDQLAKVARPLRENEISTTNPESAQLASRALGLSARLAERLGRNELDRKGAADALAELNQAIAAYEEHAAAEEARCAQPEAGATPVNGAEATPVTGRGATPVAR